LDYFALNHLSFYSCAALPVTKKQFKKQNTTFYYYLKQNRKIKNPSPNNYAASPNIYMFYYEKFSLNFYDFSPISSKIIFFSNYGEK